jgi:hypothetical protein
MAAVKYIVHTTPSSNIPILNIVCQSCYTNLIEFDLHMSHET